MSLVTKPTEKIGWLSLTPNSIKVPEPEKKEAGWSIEKPPFENFNWFWNLTSSWVDYIDILHNDKDLTINCTTQAEFLAAIQFINLITKNTGTITINNTSNITVPITLYSIRGNGTIQINSNVTYESISILDTTNKVRLLGTNNILPTSYNPLNPTGLLIKNSLDTFISNVTCKFGYGVTIGFVPTARLLKIEKSKVYIQNLVLDGENTLGMLPYYLFEIIDRSTVEIFTNTMTVTSGTSDSYGKAYIFIDPTSELKLSPNFMSNIYPIEVFGPELNIDFGLTMEATAANVGICESLLSSLTVCNTQLNINFSTFRSSPIQLTNIIGRGIINFNTIYCNHVNYLRLINNKVQINFQLINSIHSSTTFTPLVVEQCQFLHIEYLGITAILGNISYACKFVTSNVTIHQIVAADGSNDFTEDRYVEMTNCNINIDSLSHIFVDTHLKMITAKSSKLLVKSSIAITPANIGVRVLEGTQLIARKSDLTYEADYNGDIAVF